MGQDRQFILQRVRPSGTTSYFTGHSFSEEINVGTRYSSHGPLKGAFTQYRNHMKSLTKYGSTTNYFKQQYDVEQSCQFIIAEVTTIITGVEPLENIKW